MDQQQFIAAFNRLGLGIAEIHAVAEAGPLRITQIRREGRQIVSLTEIETVCGPLVQVWTRHTWKAGETLSTYEKVLRHWTEDRARRLQQAARRGLCVPLVEA